MDWKRKLHNITQGKDENVTEFLARIRLILNKTDNIEASMNKCQLDERTLQIFWYKSRVEIEKSLTLKNPRSVEEAMQHALVVEEQFQGEQVKKKPKVEFSSAI